MSRRLYRLLLRAFPLEFRRRFGAEMEVAFLMQLREARDRKGVPGVAGAWARAVPLAMANGWAERWTQAAERRAARRTAQRAFPAAAKGGVEMGGRQVLLAARSLARAPRYTLAVVVTFALVIEASTLFFAVVDAVVLRPLPYPEPEELVFVGQERDEGPPGVNSAWALLRLAEGTQAVEGVAAFSTYVITLTGAGDPIRLNLAYTSASYFDVVGVPPAVGRGFLDAEAGPGAPSVVVISDRLWRDRFGADPALVSRTVRLDEWPYEVVGIMPPGFRAPDELFRERAAATDVWMPSPRDPLADGPGYQTVRGVARLAPGASLERLEAEADLVAAGLAPNIRRTSAAAGSRSRS